MTTRRGRSSQGWEREAPLGKLSGILLGTLGFVPGFTLMFYRIKINRIQFDGYLMPIWQNFSSSSQKAPSNSSPHVASMLNVGYCCWTISLDVAAVTFADTFITPPEFV